MAEGDTPLGALSDDDVDALVDAALRPGPVEPDPRLADLVAALAATATDVPETVAGRHLAALRLAAATTGTPALAYRRGRRRAARAVTAGFLMGAVLAGGAGVAAAANARPGDVLYGLKTARERLQLSMARPGDSRAEFEVKLARTRLDEATHLLREGKTALAVETLARADAALVAARTHGSDSVDAKAADELSRRVVVLTGLLDGGLPDTAADAARNALENALDRGGRPEQPGSNRPGTGRPTPTSTPGTPSTRPSQKPSERPTPDRTGRRPTERPTHGNGNGQGNGQPTTPGGVGKGKR